MWSTEIVFSCWLRLLCNFITDTFNFTVKCMDWTVTFRHCLESQFDVYFCLSLSWLFTVFLFVLSCQPTQCQHDRNEFLIDWLINNTNNNNWEAVAMPTVWNADHCSDTADEAHCRLSTMLTSCCADRALWQPQQLNTWIKGTSKAVMHSLPSRNSASSSVLH